MQFREIPLKDLIVNPANDRHGDQGSESAAISWLFENKPKEMSNLIFDVAQSGGLLDPPLVMENAGQWVVHDGNRRITALKALADDIHVPDEFQKHVEAARTQYSIEPDQPISCQVEDRQEVIDVTLSRRHGGTDHGRGQLRWDTRAQANYARRVGANSQYPIAEAVEKFLEDRGYPHHKAIKRSTLYRLLNSKKRQARFGISLGQNGELSLHDEPSLILDRLSRIADDIVDGKLTLKHVLNKNGIDDYLNGPDVANKLIPVTEPQPVKKESKQPNVPQPSPRVQRRPRIRQSLIPREIDYSIEWRSGQGKIQQTWKELTFDLSFARHEISLPMAFRTLIELTVENTAPKLGMSSTRGKLASRVLSLAKKLSEEGVLESNKLRDIERFATESGSAREFEALNRAVHGPGYSVSPQDLISMWNVVEPLLLSAIQFNSSKK